MGGAIQPGAVWLDTNGNRIQAHGGSVLYEDGTFYWYGENKERTTPGSGVWHWGVRCYSSTDLCIWDDRGVIIPPEPDEPTSPLHPAQKVDRPHIIRNPRTGQYVCWVKIMEDDGQQRSTVLVSEALLGPYEIVRTRLRPLGMSAGDFDLVVDPTDGKGYYFFERVHSELICADLTDDYTDVTGYYSTHFPRRGVPDVREAPAYFRRRGKHYLITSGTTAYFPNRSEVAVADTYHGPYTVLGDPHVNDPSGTSFRSQVSSVLKHPTIDDLYIAIADRWLPHLSEAESEVTDAFRRVVTGTATRDEVVREHPQLAVEADTSLADYVWLPIRFDGDVPRIEWRDEWHPKEFE
jgi:hypothetical protein